MPNLETVVRKRVASLWKVAPFRVDVQVGTNGFLVSLDGAQPPADMIKLIEADVDKVVKNGLNKMN